MKIDLVDDPHEIYHHLLKVMVESLMLQRGPPVSDFTPMCIVHVQLYELFS